MEELNNTKEITKQKLLRNIIKIRKLKETPHKHNTNKHNGPNRGDKNTAR